MIEEPLQLDSGATLKNRLAKASMTEGLADLRGHPSQAHLTLYGRWAQGGAGLLLTGNVMIDDRHLERVGNLVLEDGEVADELKAMTAAGTQGGVHLWAQLNHPGRQTPRFIAPEPLAPSAVPAVKMMRAFGNPRALGEEEVEDLIDRFAGAAALAERAGFTGVQLHGAHGYLINQFLSPLTNRRRDRWGGGIENRARFLLEAVRAVHARVSPALALSVKLNSADFQRGGFSEEESMAVIDMLGDEKIDLLEISGGNYESPVMFTSTASESTRRREAYFLDYATKVRGRAKMPLMMTGGFRSRGAMEEALSGGAVDVIGLARPLAYDAEFPAKLLSGMSDRSEAPQIRVRPKSLSPMAEGAWYNRQIQRMGEGLDPDPSLGGLSSGLRGIAIDFLKARRWRAAKK